MTPNSVPFFSSIRFKLIAAGTLLALLTIVAISSVFYINFSKAMIEKEQGKMSQTIEIFNLKLKAALADIEGDTQVFSSSPAINHLIKVVNDYDNTGYSSHDVLLRKENLKSVLSENLQSRDSYRYARFINIKNKDIALVNIFKDELESEEKSRGNELCFTQAIELEFGEVFINEPYAGNDFLKDAAGQDIAGCMSTPVYDKTGQLFGVLILGFSWNEVFKTLLIGSDDKALFYLVGDLGSLLIYPEHQQVYFSGHQRQLFIQREFPVLYQNLLTDTKKNNVYLLHNIAGEKSVISISSFYLNQGINKFNLYLVASSAYSDVVATALVKISNLVGGVLFVGILILIIAVIVASSLTRPIGNILSALDAYTPGKPAPYLPLKRKDEIGVLARAYREVMRSDEAYRLEIARRIAERSAMQAGQQRMRSAIEQSVESILIVNAKGFVEYANKKSEEILSPNNNGFLGKHYTKIGWNGLDKKLIAELNLSIKQGKAWQGDTFIKGDDGAEVYYHISVSPVITEDDKVDGYAFITRDITKRVKLRQDHKTLEEQLHQANKLESVGRLAAGIAHEINTPIQYVSDNTIFLQKAFVKLMDVLQKNKTLFEASKNGAVSAEIIETVEESYKNAKIEFLIEQINPAFSETLEGLERVAKIVGAMKEFSHPAQEKTLVDINRSIDSTLIVASNEWKYVTNIETSFDSELPLVPCLPGEFNQVILNIIVNAAHAIGEKLGDGGEQEKGIIHVETKKIDRWVEISISDSGVGMSEDVSSRIFDAFFTTKEVGEGTGQGLSMVHNVVVDKLGGTIDVDSTPGKGTTFRIRLLLDDAELKNNEGVI